MRQWQLCRTRFSGRVQIKWEEWDKARPLARLVSCLPLINELQLNVMASGNLKYADACRFDVY